MSELFEKAIHDNEVRPAVTKWSAISSESQVGASRTSDPLSNPLSTGRSSDTAAMHGFSYQQSGTTDTVIDWAKYASARIVDFVHDHPGRVATGLATAIVFHHVGEAPLIAAARGAALTTDRFHFNQEQLHYSLADARPSTNLTTIDWNSVRMGTGLVGAKLKP